MYEDEGYDIWAYEGKSVGECMADNVEKLNELSRRVALCEPEERLMVQRCIDIAHTALHLAVELAERGMARGSN